MTDVTCRVAQKPVRDPAPPGCFLEAGHLGTFCLAQTQTRLPAGEQAVGIHHDSYRQSRHREPPL